MISWVMILFYKLKRENPLKPLTNQAFIVYLNTYSVDEDSIIFPKGKASRGWWKPGASREFKKIPSELPAERELLVG